MDIFFPGRKATAEPSKDKEPDPPSRDLTPRSYGSSASSSAEKTPVVAPTTPSKPAQPDRYPPKTRLLTQFRSVQPASSFWSLFGGSSTTSTPQKPTLAPAPVAPAVGKENSLNPIDDLLRACRDGDTTQVKKLLLDKSLDPSSHDNAPIKLACDSGNFDLGMQTPSHN